MFTPPIPVLLPGSFSLDPVITSVCNHLPVLRDRIMVKVGGGERRGEEFRFEHLPATENINHEALFAVPPDGKLGAGEAAPLIELGVVINRFIPVLPAQMEHRAVGEFDKVRPGSGLSS
jgi:hypothetical protein